MKNIKPNTLKGFRDYFAEEIVIREYVVETFKRLAKRYGFEGLETPALEYSELILGQSGAEAEKLYYRFEDQGGRDVMLKYELMISMCRAVAQNINNIIFPYKRYQIQPVWRAENVQKGRLREFTQMDIDILGVESMYADAEIIAFGSEFLKELGFKKFVVRINNRKILEGILDALDIDITKFEDFYITIDKLQKIGKEAVSEILEEKGFKKEDITNIFLLLDSNDLNEIEARIGKSPVGKSGISEIKEIFSILDGLGIDPANYKLDLTLARGLASYTGPIWEFEIIDGDVGSVSGGGRYDNAVSKYVGRKVPATGTSFGLERVTQVLQDLKITNFNETPTDILLLAMNTEYIERIQELAKSFREKGKNCMIYPPTNKLNLCLGYANRKNIPWVIVVGEEEYNKKSVLVKDMEKSEQYIVAPEEALKKILG